MTIRTCAIAGALLGTVALPGAAGAALVAWTDWSSADANGASGTAGGVTVTFSGLINPAAQTDGTGFNYWATNSSTYTSIPVADNPPPDSDIIRLTGGIGAGTQTITFSAPVTNPVMAIVSMGQLGVPVDYVFGNEDFSILNVGPGIFDAGGNGSLMELAGEVLRGTEGHGLIQFNGAYTSIDWTIPNAEFWHGFQIGVFEQDGNGSVPAPSTLALLGLGLGSLGLSHRRK